MAFTVSMKIKSKIEHSKRDMQMRQCQIRVDHKRGLPRQSQQPSLLTSLLDSKRPQCPGSLKLSHTEALPWRRKDPLDKGFYVPWCVHTLFLLLKAKARTLQLSGFVSSLGISFKALWVMWAYTGTGDTWCLASLLVNTSSVTSQSPIEPSREPAA